MDLNDRLCDRFLGGQVSSSRRTLPRRQGGRRQPNTKMKKEVWFGLTIMAMVVLAAFVLLPAPSEMANGHLGLLMLALVVVAIMLGFPTAFTLMGMGMIFAWIAYKSQNPDLAVQQTLDLMVQRAYSVMMSNDVLISGEGKGRGAF